MATNSAIEWTDATWNPVTGCTKVSPACANCYIERTPPFRVRGRKFVNGHIPLEFHADRLDAPLKRKKPTVYFVNSLSDLFHEDVPDQFIGRVFETMACARDNGHIFQILTKRARRMRDFMRKYSADGGPLGPLHYNFPHVWLGVSVENQRMADERIPLLLETPAAVRFLSMEPLLGPVDLSPWLPVETIGGVEMEAWPSWVIVGGESGPRLRQTDPAWVRSIRDQCVGAGVPFFFKQWGGRTSKSGGRELDGRTWDEMPRRSGK